MKTIAMYLPQFHRIPENDEWWGEGYTEWVAVKDAEPLFDGHDQPRIPFEENYYDLLKKETMLWQASLMHKYGVDGMCFYHYWFKAGKRLLEKPAENLLQWTDVDMPFFLCWANDRWARSWSRLKSKNPWTEKYEPNSDMDENRRSNQDGVLVEQEYGEEKEWIEHFEYLLPFFMDQRYIKVNDMPVFVVLYTSDITCFRQMVECWKRLAAENGLGGLYIIGGEPDREIPDCVEGVLYREPAYSMGRIRKKYNCSLESLDKIPYSSACSSIESITPCHKNQPYFCAVTGYDETPRRGMDGIVFYDDSPIRFRQNLVSMLLKSKLYGTEL